MSLKTYNMRIIHIENALMTPARNQVGFRFSFQLGVIFILSNPLQRGGDYSTARGRAQAITV